jgi:N-terminal acetyltransferase B complex catalytic subunit
MNYIVLGKAEGQGTEWHGHVTALTVAPEYRRLHLGRNMMDLLERISDQVYHGFFVDLYVRYSNYKAIGMYEALGYSVYRRVREYYGSIGPGGVEDEDAFGTCHSNLHLRQRLTDHFRYAKTAISRHQPSICAF